MKKLLLVFLFLFLIISESYSEEFYALDTTTKNETTKIDFKIVNNYLGAGDIKKAVDLYNKIAQDKNEENIKLINELSFAILSKIVLDKDQHRDIRIEAANILSKYYGEKSFDVFSKAVNDNNYVVKMGIIKAIANIKKDTSFKLISPNINDDADNIKLAAIDALGELGGAKSEKVLKNILKSKDYFIRLSAAINLFKAGSKDGFEIIEKNGIKETVDRWRIKVVEILAQKCDSSVIDLLKKALLDNNKTIRNIAMKGLIGNKSKSIDYIIKDLLKMNEKYVQVKSAEYLLNKGYNEAVSILEGFLNDKNETIKIMAAKALVNIDNTLAIDILKNSLESKNEYLRHLAADYISELPPSSHLIKIILKAYSNDDYYVRAQAIEALGKMKSRMYFYEIKKAMYDSHSLVRMKASSIMALKGDEDGINSIIDFLNWGNDELRMFSIDVLSKSDPEKYLSLIRKIAFTDKSWCVGMKALGILVEIVNKY